jgi:biotin carboxyl carrier protein
VIYEVTIGDASFRVELSAGEKAWVCRLAEPGGSIRELEVDALLAGDVLSLLIDGRSYEARYDHISGEITLNGQRFPVEVRDLRSLRTRRRGSREANAPKKIVAPMPGKVVRVLVTEQSQVEAGQGIVVVEAMKMQNELKAPRSGTVTKLLVNDGAAVNAGDAIAVIG